MDRATIESFILSLPDVELTHRFGKEAAVFETQGQMFGLIEEGKQPVRLSLRCDPKLSNILRERYEEVMPGHKLSQKDWNTVVLTGQLELDDIKGLIRHSYQLVVGQS